MRRRPTWTERWRCSAVVDGCAGGAVPEPCRRWTSCFLPHDLLPPPCPSAGSDGCAGSGSGRAPVADAAPRCDMARRSAGPGAGFRPGRPRSAGAGTSRGRWTWPTAICRRTKPRGERGAGPSSGPPSSKTAGGLRPSPAASVDRTTMARGGDGGRANARPTGVEGRPVDPGGQVGHEPGRSYFGSATSRLYRFETVSLAVDAPIRKVDIAKRIS